ncbi:MAG: guanylate kinase [Deltaproteobacteria bacterium]|jgi:guanylate kinase|nr:guanylate kinase [Deltaproteobacteria bacterium]
MTLELRRQGVGLVLCAPSGTGKSTLTRRLLQEFPGLCFSLSATTRAPRIGESHGREYLFLCREEFCARREAGDFAEWAEVHGNLYGTPLRETIALFEQGQDVLFDVDVQGASQLRHTLPDCLLVFCFPPSLAVLETRLRGRGTDSEDAILRRLKAARQEIAHAHWFDVWIVNDDLDEAYDLLRAVYLSASLLPRLRPGLVADILKG